jgi:hypothetical protein
LNRASQRLARCALACALAHGCAATRASELVLPERPAHTNSSSAVAAVDPRVLGAVVRSLQGEVEAIRGLRFVRPVAHRVLSTEAIAAHFREETEESEAQRGDELLTVALGHLRDERAVDRDAYARMMGAEAQGFYDPRDAILTLSELEARDLTRPGPAGMEARATVVHELVHALQHQHFRERVEVDERGPAMTDGAGVRVALLEGDATLVTLEWQARQRNSRMLGTPDQSPRVARWAERAQMLTEANVPKYLLDAIELPYEAGATAVSAIYLRGGWAQVNGALSDRALRSGAMLHPERGAEGLVTVDEPALAQGATRKLSRELGELELRLLLAAVMRKERAAELAAAWRGDRVALDEDPRDRSLVLQWVVQCDSEEHARGLAAALVPLVDRWRREGCPRMRGSSATACRASVTAEASALRIERGAR